MRGYWYRERVLRLVAETLFKKMPNLKVAVPLDQVNYTPLDRDVGIVDLPVTW